MKNELTVFMLIISIIFNMACLTAIGNLRGERDMYMKICESVGCFNELKELNND